MNCDFNYILNSGLWSFVGLLSGYLLGKIECHAQRKALSQENSHDDT